MDRTFPAIITSKDGACVLIEGELEDLDDAVFAPTVCGMTDADDTRACSLSCAGRTTR